MRDAETTLLIIEDRGKASAATLRSMPGNRHGDQRRPSNRSTGEPDTWKTCKSGSEGGGWKRSRKATSSAAYPTAPIRKGYRKERRTHP